MGAILAVFAGHNPNQGGHERGDIVGAFPLGHVFGAMEGLPNFLHIRVTEVAFAKVKQFVEEERSVGLPDLTQSKLLRRRKWSVKLHALPSKAKASLRSQGRASVTASQLKPYLRHKVTEAEADI